MIAMLLTLLLHKKSQRNLDGVRPGHHSLLRFHGMTDWEEFLGYSQDTLEG